MKFSLFICFTLLLLLTPDIKSDTINVKFVGNNWCPQHCIDNKTSPGYLVEIAQEALRASNIESSMTFEPWLRAIVNVKNGTYDGLLTPAQSEEKDLLRHKISLAGQRFCFYTKKSNNITLNNLQDFNNKSIAFTKGNNLGSTFMNFIKDKKNSITLTQLVSNNSEFAPRVFRFLLARNVSAIAITEDFGNHYLGQNPDIKKLVEKKYCTKEEPLHIGLSPNNIHRSKVIATYIDIGLKKIKEDGTYDKILNKYFLKF